MKKPSDIQQAIGLGSIFVYLNIALALASSVTNIMAEFNDPEGVSGEDLAALTSPILAALSQAFPRIHINQETVLACCIAVAEVMNEIRTTKIKKV